MPPQDYLGLLWSNSISILCIHNLGTSLLVSIAISQGSKGDIVVVFYVFHDKDRSVSVLHHMISASVLS